VQEIANVYARSLFEVAKEHDALAEVREQLGEVADAIAESRDLQVYFFSPYFSSHEKKEGIGKVLSGADEHLQRFLELLAEKHRMPVIFRIRRRLDELWAEENRVLEASVTSATELDDKLVKQIRDRIEEETGRSVELDSRVDPDVLGGLVIRVGNTIMDASVRNRLERLRREVARAA
jgi:F-type H+-transporting ATPase subunit delta